MQIRAKLVPTEQVVPQYEVDGICSVCRRIRNRKVVYFLSSDTTNPQATIGFLIYDREGDGETGYFLVDNKIYSVDYDYCDDFNPENPTITDARKDIYCVCLKRDHEDTIDGGQAAAMERCVSLWAKER